MRPITIGTLLAGVVTVTVFAGQATKEPSSDYVYVAAIVADECLHSRLLAGGEQDERCRCSGDSKWCGGIALAAIPITGYGERQTARDYDAISKGGQLVESGKLCSEQGACYNADGLSTRYNGHLVQLQQPRIAPTRSEPIQSLIQKVDELQREINELKKITGPYPLRVHMEWKPDDPATVTRFKMALGNKFFNHGGLLRVAVAGELIELQDGEFLTFEAARWTPMAPSR